MIVAFLGCSGTKSEPKPVAIDAAEAKPPAEDRMPVVIDQRFETLAVIQRLSGSPVYASTGLPYLNSTDQYFAAFKGHEVVTATAEWRARQGYNRDAVARLAVYLDDQLQPTRPLDPRPPGLDDPRFAGVDLDAYLALVRDFASDANVAAFFATHAAHYARTVKTMRDFLAAHPVLPWFESVFGAKPGATYRVAMGLLNYPWNFGVRAVRADGGEDALIVMFLENADRTGAYRPGDKTLELLAHELAHTFVNHVVDAHLDELADVQRTIYAKVGKQMEAQAYGDPRIVLEESVVRAISILFLRERSTPAHAAAALDDQLQQSFLWTAELADALAELRATQGGKLPEDGMIAATKQAITRWAATSP